MKTALDTIKARYNAPLSWSMKVNIYFNAIVQKLSGNKDTKIGIAWVLHSADVSFLLARPDVE